MSVRANERAAAMLGIGVTEAKLWAFTYGGALAALGGVLIVLHYGFRSLELPTRDLDPGARLHGDRRHRVRARPAVRSIAHRARRPPRHRHRPADTEHCRLWSGSNLTLLTGLIVLAVTVIESRWGVRLFDRVSARLRARFGGSGNRERKSSVKLPRIEAPDTDHDPAPVVARISRYRTSWSHSVRSTPSTV